MTQNDRKVQDKKLMKIGDISNKELICMECGFTTWGYSDMVQHLALDNEMRVPEENCETKRIEYGKKGGFKA